MTREEAIEAIKEAYGNSEYTDEIIKALEQESKVGHWVRFDNGKYHWYLCSCCDAMAGTDEKMMAYKYCPNCGAKMESEDKE